MKTRLGFVSNSSSSSFFIVGTGNQDIVQVLWNRAGPARKRGCDHPEVDTKYCGQCGEPMWIEDEGNGLCQGGFTDDKSGLSFYGSDEPNYVGIDAAQLFKNGSSYDHIISLFVNACKKAKVDVKERDIDIHYGEAGNG